MFLKHFQVLVSIGRGADMSRMTQIALVLVLPRFRDFAVHRQYQFHNLACKTFSVLVMVFYMSKQSDFY